MKEKKVSRQTKAEKKPPKKRSVLTKANKKGQHINHFLNFLRIFVAPILWLFMPFKFFGNRKVKDGACVYVSNHYRALDVFYPAATTWEGIHFLSKKEVSTHPILGIFLGWMKVIPVNRDGSDAKAVVEAIKCLKNGQKLGIFPEGTRNKTDADFLPFKSGAALMAIKAKAPIQPMLIYKKPKWFRMTHIVMGDPIELSEYYDVRLTEEVLQEADQKLYDIMVELRRSHTEYLQSKNKKA